MSAIGLNAEAGPSVLRPTVRKPKRPHPTNSNTAPKRRKLPPPLPPKPTSSSHPQALNGNHPSLPIKVLQGQGTRRIDATRPEYGRDVVFVTRKVSLGSLMGRCKSLVVNEGYTRLTLFAMTAAIPHALLLLHALIDLLPFPKGPKGMWYEIYTGSTECVDEVSAFASASRTTDQGEKMDGEVDNDEEEEEFRGIGGIEEDEPERISRIKSTIRIDLHITPRSKAKVDITKSPQNGTKQPNTSAKVKHNRPSKRQRQAAARQRNAEKPSTRGGEKIDEEEMMNNATSAGMELDEEDEVAEEVEE